MIRDKYQGSAVCIYTHREKSVASLYFSSFPLPHSMMDRAYFCFFFNGLKNSGIFWFFYFCLRCPYLILELFFFFGTGHRACFYVISESWPWCWCVHASVCSPQKHTTNTYRSFMSLNIHVHFLSHSMRHSMNAQRIFTAVVFRPSRDIHAL